MFLQFCFPLVSFICEVPSCGSCALLELRTCTKVFGAGTVSVCSTLCTCIFLKPSLKCTYSDTHTGLTFLGLSNSLFCNTKLVCSLRKMEKKQYLFFIESCKLRSIYSRDKIFQLLLELYLHIYVEIL